MSRVCTICNKSKMSGNKVSHSLRRSRRIWSPNVHKMRIVVDKSVKSVYVCTRCLRSGKAQRA